MPTKKTKQKIKDILYKPDIDSDDDSNSSLTSLELEKITLFTQSLKKKRRINKQNKRKYSDSSYNLTSDELDTESELSVKSFNEKEKEDEKENEKGKKKEKGKKIEKEKGKESEEEKERKRKEKEKEKEKKKEILDSDFSLKNSYFYSNLSITDKSKICEYIKGIYLEKNIAEWGINDYQSSNMKLLNTIPSIRKGKINIKYIFDSIDTISKDYISKFKSSEDFFKIYSLLIKSFQIELLEEKPCLRECYFFPNTSNEFKVANLLRTCKKSIDIAIFALTNKRISASIEDSFRRGIKIRIIADDECAKFRGAEVYRLASIGIPTKTDNNARFHMHHKFAIIDNAVVITGSFNWTSQAVKYNQENILFLENTEIAKEYLTEYDKLWKMFITEITPDQAKKLIVEQEKFYENINIERQKRKDEKKKNEGKESKEEKEGK